MKPILLAGYATFCGLGYVVVSALLSVTLMFLLVTTVTGIAHLLDRSSRATTR